MLVAGALAVAGCTTGGDVAAPTSAPVTSAPGWSIAPGFETLPPAPAFSYPMGADDIVVQVLGATAGPISLPLLTVYGDRTVVAAVDGWRTGEIGDGTLQLFLDEARSVGLLDGELDRRDPRRAGEPLDIAVVLDVDGTRLDHAFDVGGIDESEAFWAFLIRSATQNVFDLRERLAADSWIACTGEDLDTCRAVDAPTSDADRPLLRGETSAELLS